MGKHLELQTADDHRLSAWIAEPEGTPRGGLVVLQEIFGVNHHIREVTERFATAGYLAIAPALFDRVQRGVELPYSDLDSARKLMSALQRDGIIEDLKASVAAVRSAGRVGAVGYCWGGALADLAACECGIDAAVSYYGRHTATWLERKPQCPVMYHFGKLDPYIPEDTVDAIRADRPEGIFHVYGEAGHGFNCDERHEYHAASAELALERSMAFFAEHLG